MPLVKFCVSLSLAMSLAFRHSLTPRPLCLDEHLALGSMLPSPPWEGRIGPKKTICKPYEAPSKYIIIV